MASLSTLLLYVLILVVFSFVPSILYLWWLRNSEVYEREPWGMVFRTFVWGAVFGVILAVVFTLLVVFALSLSFGPTSRLLDQSHGLGVVVLVVVIAPLAEELAKLIGISVARREINEVEDGMVYGGAVGLGFASTENLLYGTTALLTGGVGMSLILLGIRTISSTLLHASATASSGLGMGNYYVLRDGASVIPYYLLAVLMHSSFNLFASLSSLFPGENEELLALVGFFAAILFAMVAFGQIRGKIIQQDRSRRSI